MLVILSRSFALPVSPTLKASLLQLWSVGSPHLYTLVSEVQSGGKVSDSVNTSIGIRSIKYTGDGGFFVSHEVTIRLSAWSASR